MSEEDEDKTEKKACKERKGNEERSKGGKVARKQKTEEGREKAKARERKEGM